MNNLIKNMKLNQLNVKLEKLKELLKTQTNEQEKSIIQGNINLLSKNIAQLVSSEDINNEIPKR